VITASQIIVQNLVYLGGAVVLIVILSLVVTLRHRKPKSVESNMASFNKGLRALAPDAEPTRKRSRPAPPLPTVAPSRTRTVQTVLPAKPADKPNSASPGAPAEATRSAPGEEGTTRKPTTMEAETG
jgi:hypothetical protein